MVTISSCAGVAAGSIAAGSGVEQAVVNRAKGTRRAARPVRVENRWFWWMRFLPLTVPLQDAAIDVAGDSPPESEMCKSESICFIAFCMRVNVFLFMCRQANERLRILIHKKCLQFIADKVDAVFGADQCYAFQVGLSGIESG